MNRTLLTIILSIALLGTLTLAMVLIFMNLDSSKKYCHTEACNQKAEQMLNYMNESVDPCESFYDFACGGFMLKTLPDDQTQISSFSILNDELDLILTDLLSQDINENDSKSIKNTKKFYRSCGLDKVDETSEIYLKQILRELGNWPYTASNNNISTLEIMIQLREYNYKALFGLDVSFNPKQPRSKSIELRQPDFQTSDHYNTSQFEIEYKNLLKTVSDYLNLENKLTDQEIDDIFELDKTIAQAQSDMNQAKNLTYKNMTIAELKTAIPKFPWIDYIINGIFKSSNNITITENESILVYQMDYLVLVSEIYYNFTTTNKKTLENYFIWNCMYSMLIDFMPAKYIEAKLNLTKIVTGVDKMKPRDKFCTSYASNYMSIATSRLYVENNFPKIAKIKATEMTDLIIQEFDDILKEVDWMDDYSKNLAHDKIGNLIGKIGYPEYLYNDTYLDELYDFDLDDENFLKNGLTILKRLNSIPFLRYRVMVNREEWFLPPVIVNAMYSPNLNDITIPAGILNSPFYHASLPNYLNYGAIGSVIGHELTHGFDDLGRLFDKNGVYFPDSEQGLWSNQTIQNYLNKSKCMVDQYDNYVDPQVNKSLNGYLTLGENIADNGGLKEAFNAYQTWVAKNGKEPLLPKLKYNQNQMFFISMAQIWCDKQTYQSKVNQIATDFHSPNRFRVLGSTSNSLDFEKAFNCKKGQANDPPNKCTVW